MGEVSLFLLNWIEISFYLTLLTWVSMILPVDGSQFSLWYFCVLLCCSGVETFCSRPFFRSYFVFIWNDALIAPCCKQLVLDQCDVNQCAAQEGICRHVDVLLWPGPARPVHYWWSSIYLWLSITSALIISPAVCSCLFASAFVLCMNSSDHSGLLLWARRRGWSSSRDWAKMAASPHASASCYVQTLLSVLRLSLSALSLFCSSSLQVCMSSSAPSSSSQSVSSWNQPQSASSELQQTWEASDTEAWRSAVRNRFWWSRLWLSHWCETET